MIADSSPVDGFKGSLDVVGVKLAPVAGFFSWFAQGLAVECEAVGGVHEAVEDGIGRTYVHYFCPDVCKFCKVKKLAESDASEPLDADARVNLCAFPTHRSRCRGRGMSHGIRSVVDGE
jgi:hypothetical protein